MKKYRIITNGEQFKAQIKVWQFPFSCWCTLQRHVDGEPYFIRRDVLYNTHEEAEKDVILYLLKKEKREKWWAVQTNEG